MEIKISDVSFLETELEKIKEWQSQCDDHLSEIDRRLTALESGKGEPLPAAPVKRWIECDHTGGPTVWKWNKNIGKSVAVPAEYLDYGDLWMPYSPGEPAPEAPCEVKK